MTDSTNDSPVADRPAPPQTPVEPGPHAGLVEGNRLTAPAGAASTALDPTAPVPSRIFFGTIATLSLVADLWTKAWAEKRLGDFSTLEVVKNYFSFSLAKNRGGAWGVFQNQREDYRRAFFLLVSGLAILFIAGMYRRSYPHQTALKWGLPLVLGGALGNAFDRIRYGYVIDFVDFYIIRNGQTHHWPTFNIADVCICVGVVLMAIDMLFTKKPGFVPAKFA